MKVIVLASQGVITNYKKMGRLKQQRFILSCFWRSEVQNRDAGSTTLALKVPRECPSCVCVPAPRGPWHSLAYGGVTTLPAAFTWSSWTLCLSVSSPLIRTPVIEFRNYSKPNVTSSRDP